MLGLLRSADGERALGPQPGLAQLQALVEEMRDIGLPVELTIEGQPRPACRRVDLSAYRIVQEALTNTLKHAGAAHAAVTRSLRPTTLEVEVRRRRPTEHERRRRAGTGWSVCASECGCSAARSRRTARRRWVRRARATPPPGTRRDPRPDRRRSGARARRASADPRSARTTSRSSARRRTAARRSPSRESCGRTWC